jgi:hypothetical protein
MESSPRPLFPGWACAALAALAAFVGGCLGLHLGDAFAYALAELVDRDIAELKDVLIWFNVLGALVCAIVGIWLTLWLTRSRAWTQRSAPIALGIVTLGSAAIILDAYPWPKSSGIPVVDYELRLPAGLALPDLGNIAITIWSVKSGQGCYIRQIRMAGYRAEVVGAMVLQTSNLTPTVSLRLNNKTENYWRLPIKPDAALDKTFGPWQRIEFIPTPRANVPPLPAGDYEIRYRVRSYM